METFFDDWSLQVSAKSAAFAERFRIIGSDSSDGTYYGSVGLQLNRVSGEQWTLIMEWNDGIGSGWQPSAVRKLATYTVGEGLVKVLGADDNTVNARDNDFNDLVITCKSLDPTLNPLLPVGIPFGFTYPEKAPTPYPEKAPTYQEKAPIDPERAPTYPENYPEKAPTYQEKTPGDPEKISAYKRMFEKVRRGWKGS
jgi:hypothetical protein